MTWASTRRGSKSFAYHYDQVRSITALTVQNTASASFGGLVTVNNATLDLRGNTTFTNDDANSGPQGQPQLGNVLDNDSDPEGDTQTVTLEPLETRVAQQPEGQAPDPGPLPAIQPMLRPSALLYMNTTDRNAVAMAMHNSAVRTVMVGYRSGDGFRRGRACPQGTPPNAVSGSATRYLRA